jgi:aspartyl-tRNA(Asn)/glutamyl-tRNA(Gln) amidotransferase subunit A
MPASCRWQLVPIPAAYCGIVGLKPTFGLVPLDGVFPLSWSLDHAGPLARSIEDAALGLACLSGTPMPLAQRSLHGIRIGLLRQHFVATPGSLAVETCVRAAIESLRRQGAIITEISMPNLDWANPELVSILRPEASLIHRALLAENPDGYAPATRTKITEGFDVRATDYVAAMRFRDGLRAEVEAVFSGVDVLLSPSVPFVAPEEDPLDEDGGGDSEGLASGFANVTGHPAINLPCGFSEHLPFGLQLVGALGGDARLLSIALAIQTALNFGAAAPDEEFDPLHSHHLTVGASP